MVLCIKKYEKYIKVINLFIFFPLLQFMIHSGDKNKTNACAQDKAFFNFFFFYNFFGLLQHGIIKVGKFSVFPFASNCVTDTSHISIS